jgi:hypothetical protein
MSGHKNKHATIYGNEQIELLIAAVVCLHLDMTHVVTSPTSEYIRHLFVRMCLDVG